MWGKWSETTTGSSLGITYVLDMDSNPTPSPMSISLFLIWLEMTETDMRPEEQNLRTTIPFRYRLAYKGSMELTG